jgi:hypothetical protein
MRQEARNARAVFIQSIMPINESIHIIVTVDRVGLTANSHRATYSKDRCNYSTHKVF